MSGGTPSTAGDHNLNRTIGSLQLNLQCLINSYEKGNSADLASRLRQIESGIDALRSSVQNLASKTSADFLIQATDESETAGTSDQTAHNEEKIVCPNCGSVILLAGVGVLVRGHAVGLPKARQKRDATEVEREDLCDWWSVRNHLDFENVGFTHSLDGVRYLTCADCELGPIGYVHPENKLNLVSVHRVAYK